MTRFRIEVLKDHDRSSFDCGVEALNEYLKQRATQDARRSFTVCYVAIEQSTDLIAGFYTLSAGAVKLAELPDSSKLPRYPTVPVARIGRLAVSKSFHNIGLGGAMLHDSFNRVKKSGMGVYAICVDAKDEDAANFYLHHGFTRLPSQPLLLFAKIDRKM